MELLRIWRGDAACGFSLKLERFVQKALFSGFFLMQVKLCFVTSLDAGQVPPKHPATGSLWHMPDDTLLSS